ncbi:MAG: DUF72 domain-containing protein [Sphaerochaeta sp.]|jgi:uncharacterized protein YecE (DUF72 family)|nr:DUF72 domain-containing protein [Sphaerochaeta sp.]HBO36599.1 DUF72 domain-containing protein [Sphaerochaeta sp.]
MSTILIGTSGYSYTEWVGPVYPKGTKSEEFLFSYAQMFPTVELNFSYYRMPEAAQLALMHQGAPSLRFSIKAHQSLTHVIDSLHWREQATLFYRSLEPLLANEVLDAVLLQFPSSFHYEIDQRKYLDSLLRVLSPLPLAVEFRNSRWYNNRTLDSLRERQVSFVSLDLPQVQGNPPVMDVPTASLAYLRLHGRNKETWWGSDAASRYDYLYSDSELKALLERVLSLMVGSEKILVYFNNHRRGQAASNAKRLRELLDASGGGSCMSEKQALSIST